MKKISAQTSLKVSIFGIDAPEPDKINNHTGRISKPSQSYQGRLVIEEVSQHGNLGNVFTM
jgi:hypothetical protein